MIVKGNSETAFKSAWIFQLLFQPSNTAVSARNLAGDSSPLVVKLVILRLNLDTVIW